MCVGQRGEFPTTASNRNKTTPLAAETGATPLPTGVEKQSEERERGRVSRGGKHNNSTWNKKSENRGKEAKKWLSWASMWESVQVLSSFRSLDAQGMGTDKEIILTVLHPI